MKYFALLRHRHKSDSGEVIPGYIYVFSSEENRDNWVKVSDFRKVITYHEARAIYKDCGYALCTFDNWAKKLIDKELEERTGLDDIIESRQKRPRQTQWITWY